MVKMRVPDRPAAAQRSTAQRGQKTAVISLRLLKLGQELMDEVELTPLPISSACTVARTISVRFSTLSTCPSSVAWMFGRSPAAAMYSLIVTAKMNDMDPQA